MFFLVAIATFCTIAAYSQTTVKGVVVTKNNEAINGASILLYTNKTLRNIAQFTFTNEKGEFSFNTSSKNDSLYIAVKTLSYQDSLLRISNKSQSVKIILTQQIYQLKGVEVKSQPIIRKGDTLQYMVGSFARVQDQSIGDVIKHMPGFEVTESGAIYYQGKPIQKYYIEGLDLLEGKYAIANKNLPHKSVSSIDVMRNHQPIKILEDKIPSDATSLNIKLKKQIAYTGTLKAGLGFSPLLHKVNLTPMLFHKKQQVIASLQTNNIGDDLNSQHQPLVFKMGKLSGLNGKKKNFVHILPISPPKIDKNLFLNNSAILISYNHLIKLNKNTQLKINSGFFNDVVKEQGENSIKYFLTDKSIEIHEQITNRYFNKSFNTKINLVQNKKNRYFTNNTEFYKFWDREKGFIHAQKDKGQLAKTPYSSLLNELDIIFPLKNNLLRIYSNLDFNESKQNISYYPGILGEIINKGIDYKQTMQSYYHKQVTTDNYFEFVLSGKPFIFENKIGFKYNSENIDTKIQVENTFLKSDSLNNDLNSNYKEFYFKENIRYKKGSFHASLSLPVRAMYHQYENLSHSNKNLNYTIFTPSVYTKYETERFWKGIIRARYSHQLGNTQNLLSGYTVANYRNMKRQAGILPTKKGINYSFEIEYNNFITGLVANVKLQNRWAKKNLLFKQKILNNGFLYFDVIEKENRQKSTNISLAINQFLSKTKTTLKLDGYYGTLKKDLLFNNKFSTLRYNSFMLRPSIYVNKWEIINIESNFEFQYMKQFSDYRDLSIYKYKFYTAFSIIPNRRHIFNISFELFNSKQDTKDDNSVFFANLSYFLKPKNKKIKFKFSVNNIFNQDTYIQYFNSELSIARSSYQLRPRQFLVIMSYGF